MLSNNLCNSLSKSQQNITFTHHSQKSLSLPYIKRPRTTSKNLVQDTNNNNQIIEKNLVHNFRKPVISPMDIINQNHKKIQYFSEKNNTLNNPNIKNSKKVEKMEGILIPKDLSKIKFEKLSKYRKKLDNLKYKRNEIISNLSKYKLQYNQIQEDHSQESFSEYEIDEKEENLKNLIKNLQEKKKLIRKKISKVREKINTLRNSDIEQTSNNKTRFVMKRNLNNVSVGNFSNQQLEFSEPSCKIDKKNISYAGSNFLNESISMLINKSIKGVSNRMDEDENNSNENNTSIVLRKNETQITFPGFMSEKFINPISKNNRELKIKAGNKPLVNATSSFIGNYLQKTENRQLQNKSKFKIKTHQSHNVLPRVDTTQSGLTSVKRNPIKLPSVNLFENNSALKKVESIDSDLLSDFNTKKYRINKKLEKEENKHEKDFFTNKVNNDIEMVKNKIRTESDSRKKTRENTNFKDETKKRSRDKKKPREDYEIPSREAKKNLNGNFEKERLDTIILSNNSRNKRGVLVKSTTEIKNSHVPAGFERILGESAVDKLNLPAVNMRSQLFNIPRIKSSTILRESNTERIDQLQKDTQLNKS